MIRLFDAHNHLQDPRFGVPPARLIEEAHSVGVIKMVVNGSCEDDWNQVADLARSHSGVVPSFGYHPWYVHERTPGWLEVLTCLLDSVPASVIGEIGLDRWRFEHTFTDQEPVFVAQLQLARARELPVSIHCLQAWGRMYELLRQTPLPAAGFLLHSYGGPVEMVPGFVKLGAYFSFPGYFMHERKRRHRETFRAIPRERLLIETDAPDQAGPAESFEFHLPQVEGAGCLNHPGNLRSIHRFLASWLGTTESLLAADLEENFTRLFGHRSCKTRV